MLSQDGVLEERNPSKETVPGCDEVKKVKSDSSFSSTEWKVDTSKATESQEIQEMRATLRHQGSRALESESSRQTLAGGCQLIVSSIPFTCCVNVLTFVNAVQMGFEVDYPEWEQIWLISEFVFTSGFLLEMIMKCFAMRLEYLKDRANCLDCFITVLAVIDLFLMNLPGIGYGGRLQSVSILRILRVLRLARILKLVRSLKPVVLVIQGVMKTFATLCNVFTLLVVICYVFAIFFTEHLGKSVDADLYPGYSDDAEVWNHQSFMADFNPHACFGSMTLSMMTLYNMATLSEWSEIVRPIALKQPFFVPLFFAFGVLVAFGVMNVMIGLIVDDVITESKKMDDDLAEEELRQKMVTLEKVQEILWNLDTDGDGVISTEELTNATRRSSEFQEALKSIKLPSAWTPEELVTLLDNDANGILESGEFAKGFFRLLESNDFQQLCMMQTGINQVKHMIRSGNQEIQGRMLEISSELSSMKAALGMASDTKFHRHLATAACESSSVPYKLQSSISPVAPKAPKRGPETQFLDAGVPPVPNSPICRVSENPISEKQSAVVLDTLGSSFQELLGKLADEHCREVGDLQARITHLHTIATGCSPPSTEAVVPSFKLPLDEDDFIADERASNSFLRYSLNGWRSLESESLSVANLSESLGNGALKSSRSELNLFGASHCNPATHRDSLQACLCQGIARPKEQGPTKCECFV